VLRELDPRESLTVLENKTMTDCCCCEGAKGFPTVDLLPVSDQGQYSSRVSPVSDAETQCLSRGEGTG